MKIVDVTNLRQGAGLDYEIIGKAKPGETYSVIGTAGEWYNVSLPEGGTAYVAGWVVDAGEQSCEPGAASRSNIARLTEKGAVVKIVDTTNLRDGPGLENAVIAKAKPGESYPIVGSVGEWVIVGLPAGSTAYVASWVVEIESPGGGKSGDRQACDAGVFIYHSHNLESWKSVVGNKKGSSFDNAKINITLVGKQLAKRLNAKGISSVVAQDDFSGNLKLQKLGFSNSYAESRKAVDKARKANPKLRYFFDIHRDADVPRAKTTATIGKKTYARIMFVVGTGHPNYKENMKFAEDLNALLKKRYPGLSRGILTKGAHQGDGVYNQSVSPGSLLLEIGGVNNTPEESERAADAFAEVFAQYYKTAK